MKRVTTIAKLAVRMHKWKLLVIMLTFLAALVTRNVLATRPPPGSAPTPDIDPL